MKTPTDKLLEEISVDLNQFLKYGNINSFSKKIDPNLNIDNIEKLLRIHFVLTTTNKESNEIGVIDFIEKLPEQLRRIKTTTKMETEIFDGEVKGRINWKDTIKERRKQYPPNKTQFACNTQEKNYEIAENQVLKSLLQTIHNIIHNDLNIAFEKKYKWLKQWVEEKELKMALNQLFFRNVYLKRIDISNTKVTERMINKASKSRIQLYRDAAFLLSHYRRLMNYEFEPTEAKELLKNTFIEPEKSEVLFELYWIIKIVKQFNNPTFQLIEPNSNVVAKWNAEGDNYKIYHDSNGSFQFKENLEELNKKLKDNDNYIGRELKVFKKLQEMTERESKNIWDGRPDILLEKYDQNNNLVSIFIGEVKYTNNRDYAIKGLKELLEYIALIKNNEGAYIENYENLFGRLKTIRKTIRGCLFLDKINNLNIKSNNEIQTVMFGEDKKIADIVQQHT